MELTGLRDLSHHVKSHSEEEPLITKVNECAVIRDACELERGAARRAENGEPTMGNLERMLYTRTVNSPRGSCSWRSRGCLCLDYHFGDILTVIKCCKDPQVENCALRSSNSSLEFQGFDMKLA
ncbi:membrane-associated guanylate kinase, WW and PDZ domain-containing protein 1-like isoform X1 [Lates japonicus]|uniref:Membrane-associated guanylate kinase, WW and PDZ domain-containing protein 1-like isoform X1 n=1 Tax=Lates japonicus TaxID=270547 RepID=A0AAD3NIU4_LATJO|nr:membrane-associated guanylate kinase, WW and PDZ domain-containing protein 1-like isoform X1 [Lates japonicus]